jgi:hypothetical protein
MNGARARRSVIRDACKTVVGKPEGKRLLRRVILKWILEKLEVRT